jgi:hypothetical protein
MYDSAMYLKDLQRAPEILAAISAAKENSAKSATLSFSQFHDDPFLMFATAGFAYVEGIDLVLKAGNSVSDKVL